MKSAKLHSSENFQDPTVAKLNFRENSNTLLSAKVNSREIFFPRRFLLLRLVKGMGEGGVIGVLIRLRVFFIRVNFL